MLKNKKLIIGFSFVIQIIMLKVLANFPEFVERYYSNGLYVFISKLMRYSFGWLPFSMGDILYTLLAVYVIRWFVLNRKRVLKDTKNFSLDILSAFSIGYFAFHMLWAINYYRLPLHKSLQINDVYNTEELVTFTTQLIAKSNTIQVALTGNDSTKVEFPYSKTELLDMVPQGYHKLAKTFPHLDYQPQSLKRSIYSLQLTYMGFSGYLNPFTNEAQIDGLLPAYKYPTTSSHEAAHQLGYAAENEANFIGSMAAMHHKNPYFNYSGYTFALNYCLNELYKTDPETYERLSKTINEGIKKNFREVRDFWNAYENPLEPAFKSSYNSYLKANNQAKGIESYNYAVALWVNYFKTNPL
ncbi:DUF3810 domain-containing protein [Geojedonia litorea]|uniref:DUF3810 domain-containing protein n=1 Tax=Geojedonia litorea TaxID=1268269 RepID=A0ABV9N7Q9_9FLAO